MYAALLNGRIFGFDYYYFVGKCRLFVIPSCHGIKRKKMPNICTRVQLPRKHHLEELKGYEMYLDTPYGVYGSLSLNLVKSKMYFSWGVRLTKNVHFDRANRMFLEIIVSYRPILKNSHFIHCDVSATLPGRSNCINSAVQNEVC